MLLVKSNHCQLANLDATPGEWGWARCGRERPFRRYRRYPHTSHKTNMAARRPPTSADDPWPLDGIEGAQIFVNDLHNHLRQSGLFLHHLPPPAEPAASPSIPPATISRPTSPPFAPAQAACAAASSAAQARTTTATTRSSADCVPKLFSCNHPGCQYTSDRSNNVKRHYRGVHTRHRPHGCRFCPCALPSRRSVWLRES